ncbi:hypothetical protein ABZ403_19885 [Micromonospora zamorensis]|uniref:hypothetical protein n=1 Tax=Micromonospora zamorensis TaxID=709883 RepID=UPI0033FA8769
MPSDPSVDFLHRAHQLCEDQADDLREALGRYMDGVGGPGTVAARDHARLLASVRSADRQTLWSKVGINCLHLAVNVADHVRAVAVLLAQPQAGVPIYAHETVARGAVESAAMLMYILDREQAFESRFARGVAHLIADATAARSAASVVPRNAVMASPLAAVTQERDRLIALIRRARIELVMGRRDVKGVRVVAAGPEAPIAVKATDLIQARFADLPAVYHMLSGVAHGMPWRLSDSAHVEGRFASWEPDPIYVGTSALVAMAAAERAVKVHAWYRGFDEDPMAARMQARVAAADAALAAFGRKRLGLTRMPPSVAPFLSPSV